MREIRTTGRVLALAAISIFALSLAPEVFAQVPGTIAPGRSCGCYCGKMTYPPCSDEKCKQECGYYQGSGGGGGMDQQMMQQGYEMGQAIRQAYDEQKAAEADAERLRAIEEARRLEEERRQFEIKKQQTLQQLKSISYTPSTPGPSPELTRIMRKLNHMQPPPIPSAQAQLELRIKPDDRLNELLLLAADNFLLLGQATGKLYGTPLGVMTLILAGGKTFIAMEDGADLYLCKQDAVYEKALGYLRNPAAAAKFSKIVHALRNNSPLPQDADPAMVEAAKALVDPRLGNAGWHLASSAMWSPEARAAGLKAGMIETGGYLLGKGTENVAGELLAERDPAFRYASASLERAETALKTAKDLEYRGMLKNTIAEANRVIAYSYGGQLQIVAGAAAPYLAQPATDAAGKKLEKKIFEEKK